MLPLTEQNVHDIQFRLDPVFTKYTWTSLILWDPEVSKFILATKISGYRFGCTWLVHSLSQVSLVCFIIFIYSLVNSSSETSDASPGTLETLIIFFMLLYGTCLAAIIWFASVLLEYQEECVDAFNNAFDLDAKFKSMIRVKIPAHDAKYSNRLIRLSCYFPLVVPFLFLITLFHPLDPVHIFLERVIEIHVSLNWTTFCLACLEFFGVTCFMTWVTIVILMGAVSVMVPIYWMCTTMPKTVTTRRGKACVIQTENGRQYDSEKLVWVYRSLQCLVAVPNRIVMQNKYVAHAKAMLVVWVVSAFVLIRYKSQMLNGSPVGIIFVAIFAFGFVIGVGVDYIESFNIGYMEEKCISYKTTILKQTSRRSELYKTARSFRPVGGMFYNMNTSAYTEWIDAGISYLTTLLVSFEFIVSYN